MKLGNKVCKINCFVYCSKDLGFYLEDHGEQFKDLSRGGNNQICVLERLLQTRNEGFNAVGQDPSQEMIVNGSSNPGEI